MPDTTPAFLWDPPRLIQNRSELAGVRWLELVFDLAVVIALAGLSHLWFLSVSDPSSWGSHRRFLEETESEIHVRYPWGMDWHVFSKLLVFIGILHLLRIWRWEVFYQSSLEGDNDIFGRCITCLFIILFASAYPLLGTEWPGTHPGDVLNLFSICHALVRLVIMIKCIRVGLYVPEEDRPPKVMICIFLEMIFLFIGFLSGDDLTMVILFFMPMVSLFIRLISNHFMIAPVKTNEAHISERFSLFVVLLTGEGLVTLFDSLVPAMEHKDVNPEIWGIFTMGAIMFLAFWQYRDNMRHENQHLSGNHLFLWHISHITLVPAMVINFGFE